MKIPYLKSDYRILFKPTINGDYMNDHTIIIGSDGNYHIFGISSLSKETNCNPYMERRFVHGVGPSLDSPLKEVGVSVDRGLLAWAPAVIKKDNDYYMIYGPSPTRLCISFDMYEWYRHNLVIKNEPPFAVHRDHFVLKYKNKYIMYAVGTHNHRSSVSICVSKDLINWKFKGFALTSGEHSELNPGWGAFESPFVIEKDGYYYLFITYTTSEAKNYNNTYVFASKNPFSFGEYDGMDGSKIKPITTLFGHAGEVIEKDGKYYITTCGWYERNIPNEGAVSIADLGWKDI